MFDDTLGLILATLDLGGHYCTAKFFMSKEKNKSSCNNLLTLGIC